MPTDGFKRLMWRWRQNSYFHSSSNVKIADPTFDKYNPAANLKGTKEKIQWSEIFLPLKPYLNVIMWILIYCGYVSLRFVVELILSVFFLLNGTYVKVLRNRRRENFAQSARVFDVLGRHKFDIFVSMNQKSDFILRHREFDHPNRVLSDEASLYCVNSTEAVFIETAPGVEVWRGKYNSFHMVAQLQMAVRVIVMPIDSFYKLADKMGDPSGRLVFITNTARCGSTLLSRIYEKTDDFVSLAEPNTINYFRKFTGHEDDPWVQYHSRSVVRMLCKKTHTDNFAVKISAHACTVVPLLKALYPDARFLFMYRNILPVAKSVYKIMKEVPWGQFSIGVANVSPRLYVACINSFAFYEHMDYDESFKITPGYGQAVLLLANTVNIYRSQRASGIPIVGIKYEDLIENKELALRQMFNHIGVSGYYVPLAMRAFDDDSQANSIISMSTVRKTQIPPLTDDIHSEMNKMCAAFRLPAVMDEFVLEGTITRPQRSLLDNNNYSK